MSHETDNLTDDTKEIQPCLRNIQDRLNVLLALNIKSICTGLM